MEKIKIGDNIKIIQGKDKGQLGTIKLILRKNHKVIVEGINKKIRHIKSFKKNKIGKIQNFSASLDRSNLMVCDKIGLVSKIKFIFKNQIKVRILKKTNELY